MLLRTQLSSVSNAPVATDGDYVFAGAGVPEPDEQQLILASELGAGGQLPDTVGS
jgi:hypothetical protein